MAAAPQKRRSVQVRQQLLNLSAATIDRLLAPARMRHPRRGLSTTKPGSLLRHQVALRGGPANTTEPGHLEADTVAHCGDTTAGDFVLPKAKLSEKQKLGRKYRRRYEKPQTPLQRLLESPDVTAESQAALRAQHAQLNPFHLREELERKLRLFFNLKSNLNYEATMS